MAYKICLQSGHWNKAGSGAPNEQATNKRITDRLTVVLREKGFEVYQTDWYANNDPKVTGVDYSLFLALHCDMDYPNDNGSGFADYPEPSTDGATVESQRIVNLIIKDYFPEVGIKYVNHSNANTRFYYMWKYLTAKTPCALLEMGQSIDPHDSVLLANTSLIANAIARCVCKAFNVPFDPIVPPVTPPADIRLKLLNDAGITDEPKTRTAIERYNKYPVLEKDKDNLQLQYNSLKSRIKTAVNSAIDTTA